MSSSTRAIEAVYPLSPVQEGILFHTYLAPDTGVYVIQRVCTLPPDLDVPLLKRAWQHVVQRHSILRTAFVFESSERPLQVVGRQVQMPWELHDWRTLSAEEEQQQLEAVLQSDRRRGFPVTNAPLMRVQLFQRRDGSYYCLWSFHHAILDGWPWPIVLDEVYTYYQAARQDRECQMVEAQPYQSYIAWLQRQDLARAERFWRNYLQGYTRPLPFGPPQNEAQDAIYEEQIDHLPPVLAETLQTFLRRHRLTANTVFQGAWALLLSDLSGQDDVVFGATVSGRPATIAGIETMVGMFINTLPVRVRLAGGQSVLSWLHELHLQQADLQQYEYSPLMQIQKWSEVPRGTPLFESLLVCATPTDQTERGASPETGVVRFVESSNYPLMLNIEPGKPFIVQAIYEQQRFERLTIRQILARLQDLLEQICHHPDLALSEIHPQEHPEWQALRTRWRAFGRASQAMPHGEHEEPTAYCPPGTAVEKALVEIWEEVLKQKRVGVNHTFFELGGDSIMSIRIVSRANQRGIKLTSQQIFQFQTIAKLATVAVVPDALQADAQKQAAEPVLIPLTPIQCWFFERPFPKYHHWNLAFLFQASETLEPRWIQASLNALLARHDSLRLRFRRGEKGWEQWSSSTEPHQIFEILDGSSLSDQEYRQWVHQQVARLQGSLALEQGPLLRVALFDFGERRPQQVLFIVHHLAVDIISWRIILNEFQEVYRQQRTGASEQLPAVITSFQSWAEQLQRYARSSRLMQERDYWLKLPWHEVRPLPVDNPAGENKEHDARMVSTALTAQETQTLLREVAKTYHMQAHEILLAALAATYTRWTGVSTLLIDLEGHGREDILDGVDLSRTTGWLTALAPLCLTITPASTIGELLPSVKEQIRALPQGGIGYGLLRYCSPNAEDQRRFAAFPHAEMAFHYEGRSASLVSDGAFLIPADDVSTTAHHPESSRSHRLAVSGRIIADCLHITIIYGQQMYHQSTMDQLLDDYLETLRSMIKYSLTQEEEYFTPSDFPEAALSQAELDDVLESLSQEMEL